MKNKHFYSHIVETTDLTLEIAELDLTPQERVHLISLLEANIHSVVMQTILLKLSNEEKKVFLKNLLENDHEKIWKHLNETTENIEAEIEASVKNLKKELYKDIKEAKEKG